MGLSPMMQQYLATKEIYKDCILFYRLGDFYEMFFDDAKVASAVLDLTLTGRSCGLDERAPMCGVPYHAVDVYIAKLIENGYKVAICEQLSEPVAGKIVARDVVRVVTPGTVIEDSILDEKKNNYIISIFKDKSTIGIAYADVSTGQFFVSEFIEDAINKLNDALVRIRPAEIICNKDMFDNVCVLPIAKAGVLPNFQSYLEYSYDYKTAIEAIKKHLNISSIVGHDFSKLNYAVCASGALFCYLQETQKRTLTNINKISIERFDDYLYLDLPTVRNLELVETAREQKKKGSLLWLLDKTKTSMGARLLRNYMLQPLQNETKINNRLDCVQEISSNRILLNDIQNELSKIKDIERLASKVSFGTISPRDCLALKYSLSVVHDLKLLAQDLKSSDFNDYFADSNTIADLCGFLDSAIDENCPALQSAGNFIKFGFNEELDELRKISINGKDWIVALENKEKELTGIKGLKIGYTRVFGYYIEINKSQIDAVPFRYQRKQTISNHERYITEELKELEEKILNSQELSGKLEQQLYDKIKEYLYNLVPILQKVSKEISYLDFICSLSQVSLERGYVRPTIGKAVKHIKIKDGRHPVVEALLKDEQFIPNDTLLDNSSNRTMIITGPNMAGKSTYMRQVAVITLMAHIGSFVPAESAEISIVDRIFTRIGASDDLIYGQSTFMVEMIEVANIINNATKNSLLLLDEVGRGTSTFDGMSIAWSVIEYISQKIKAKTLFSTHYHEISELEGQLEGVKNYRITVKEFNNSIIFLRKIVRGGANKSFGIEVASLSGIYPEIISRAKQILYILEEKDINRDSNEKSLTKVKEDNIFNAQIISVLKEININKVSPMEAFEILNDLSTKAKKE